MLLFEAAKIRKRIRTIMSKRSGRRVALVAYVGQDALRYIPEPDGVEIFCSDNAVATNPLGLEKLLNGPNGQGAAVWFVQSLHMKVYWSENAGVLIGSPNLSQNALGDGGLIEAAYFAADSSKIDIDAVVASVRAQGGARRVTPKVLADFKRRHDLATDLRQSARNSVEADIPEFSEYTRAQFRAPFKIAVWSDNSDDWTSTLRLVAKHENISVAEAKELVIDSIEDMDPIFERGDWVLALKVNDAAKVTACSWFFVDGAFVQRKNAQVIVEMRGGRRGNPPFSYDNPRMRHAFTVMALKRPALLDECFVPSPPFLQALAKRYAR